MQRLYAGDFQMRIAIHTHDLPENASVFSTCGSENRWALNWLYLLREQGHEVVQVTDNFSSSEVFDVYFHTVRRESVDCGSGNVLSNKHVHLSFGLLNLSYVRGWPCVSNRLGALAFPNWEIMSRSEPSVLEYNYTRYFLPTPYPESLRPDNILPVFRRRELTWMLKRVWGHRPLSAHELGLDSYVDVAIWTLEAIRDLSHKHELIFNYVKENFYGWGMEPMPAIAQRVLESIRGLNYLENLDFRDVLNLMGRSKLSISIAGLTGSALESVFCGSVPLAYDNPILSGGHFIIPNTLTSTASSLGLTLPRIDTVSKQDIRVLLEALWENDDLYLRARSAFLKDFSFHTE